MTAQLPPPKAAHVPPLATPWRAPAWKLAQPASSEQGDGSAAATRGSTRAASRHTVARASVEASAARIERAWQQLSCRHPRQHMCRLSPHRGARQRRSQRSPHRASRAAAHSRGQSAKRRSGCGHQATIPPSQSAHQASHPSLEPVCCTGVTRDRSTSSCPSGLCASRPARYTLSFGARRSLYPAAPRSEPTYLRGARRQPVKLAAPPPHP